MSRPVIVADFLTFPKRQEWAVEIPNWQGDWKMPEIQGDYLDVDGVDGINCCNMLILRKYQGNWLFEKC